MIELITNKITASVLWVPEAWHRYGFTEEEIEKAVAHIYAREETEFELIDKEELRHWFHLKDEPLEFKSESYQGVVEIQVFTLSTMTRHYVSITPERA
jgi:hypothetical protein